MEQTIDQSIEYQRAMDALQEIQKNPCYSMSSLEKRAWKYVSRIVYEVENYRQHEKHHMTWDFSWAHTYDTVGYRSCWSPDPEGLENDGAAWHVSDAGVEFRIILDTHGCSLIEIVGELDGYGEAATYEIRYRDDYDGENGVLDLRRLDNIWRNLEAYNAPDHIDGYVHQCIEDYCGRVAGPIQDI